MKKLFYKKFLYCPIFVLILILSLSILTVYSCGGGGGGGSVSAPHSYIPKPPSKQPVVVTPSVTYKLTYNIPASKINAGDTVYLARLNLSNTAYTTPSSEITLSANLNYNSESTTATPENFLPFISTNKSYRVDSPTVFSFNNSKEAFVKTQSNITSRAAQQKPFNAAGVAQTGATLDVKVIEYENGKDKVVSRNATLIKEGKYTNVWFVNGAKDANGNIISDDDIQNICNEIAKKFDQIYTEERNIFGEERNNSVYNPTEEPVSTKVNIVLANLNDKYNGSYLGGYFYGIDYFDEPKYSNYGKFFYIDAAITKRTPYESYSTLVHEFQHMIQFNQKTKCETWFNEMLSMTAEDLLASIIFGNTVTDGKSFPQGSVQDSRIYHYLSGYYISGITDWLSGEYVLYSYSTAYMFGAYLFRNYGANYISTLSKSSAVGDMTLIKNTLGANYDAMLKNYYKALLPPYNRQNTPSFYKDAAFQGYTLPKIKIDEVIYWKIENGQIVNAGPVGAPKIFEKTDTLPNLRPYGMIIQRISTGGNGGAATITVSKSATENCYIVVVKSDGTIE